MALFEKNKSSPGLEAMRMRQQGLTDEIISDELSRKGYSEQEVNQALDQPESFNTAEMSLQPEMSMPSNSPQAAQNDMGNIYERIEEITENMIDEKWDDLISEVKKIIEWKENIEEKQTKMISDLEKLKEDFKGLHQGVLGKLEDYDTRMRDVGAELKAVGKVFKDVIPEFVENVKELKNITKSK